MSADEQRELNKMLSDCAVECMSNHPIEAPPLAYAETASEAGVGKMSQWTTSDGTRFFPAGRTVDILKPGSYEIKHHSVKGYYFEKILVKQDGLVRFPESNSEKVISDIQNFWNKEDAYKNFGLTYKRGIILWGPPGSGKSCTIQIIMNDVIERGGIVLKFNVHPSMFMEALRIFREVQPDTRVLVLMEDIDSILQNNPESEVINILDGVDRVEKVVFLATTNYPERLGSRIINRPSRFDKRFRMPTPNKKCRRLYFEHLIKNVKKNDIDIDIDIDKWVKQTENMSIAHLKELFVSVCILNNNYSEAIEILQAMNEHHPDSEKKSMGFYR